MSKHVAPFSPTFLSLTTSHVSVSHLQTNATRGEFFVRVRGGTVLMIVYSVFGSVGWNRAALKLLPAKLPGSVGRSIVLTNSKDVVGDVARSFPFSDDVVFSVYTRRLTVVAITS